MKWIKINLFGWKERKKERKKEKVYRLEDIVSLRHSSERYFRGFGRATFIDSDCICRA